MSRELIGPPGSTGAPMVSLVEPNTVQRDAAALGGLMAGEGMNGLAAAWGGWIPPVLVLRLIFKLNRQRACGALRGREGCTQPR